MAGEFYSQGTFLCIDGPAKKAGREHSEVKVCITCRDDELLRQLIAKVAEDEECYWVKMSTKARDGMFLGRCFFTTKEYAGRFWARYKSHPRLMVTLQDDDFASGYRALVRSWKDQPDNALD
jgi:hypothetical protein